MSFFFSIYPPIRFLEKPHRAPAAPSARRRRHPRRRRSWEPGNVTKMHHLTKDSTTEIKKNMPKKQTRESLMSHSNDKTNHLSLPLRLLCHLCGNFSAGTFIRWHKTSPPEKPLQHHHGVSHPLFRSLGRDKIESGLGAGCKGEAKVDVFWHTVVYLKKALGYHNV